MKQQVVWHEVATYQDQTTGVPVKRLTSPQFLAGLPYFYNRVFSSDGKKMLHYIQEDGIRKLYLMDLAAGCSTLLCDEPGLASFSANFSKDNQFVFFVKDKSIIKQSLATNVQEVLYVTDPEWWGYDNPSFDTTERYIVTIEMLEQDRLSFSEGWDLFAEQWARHPLCRVVIIDTQTKTTKIVHQEHCWLGHPQFRPGDASMVSFCHEGPSHLVDSRLWAVKDGKVMCLRAETSSEMITHEFWLENGSAMGYVHRTQDNAGKELQEIVDLETFAPKVDETEMKQTIYFLQIDTGEERLACVSSKYCHCITNPTDTVVVGDGQLPEQAFIYVTDLHSGQEKKVCAHATSWRPYQTNQDSHPHPRFTPDGTAIVFVSDQDGLPAIYYVELNQ